MLTAVNNAMAVNKRQVKDRNSLKRFLLKQFLLERLFLPLVLQFHRM